MKRNLTYIRPELKFASVQDLTLLCLSDMSGNMGTEDIVLDDQIDLEQW